MGDVIVELNRHPVASVEALRKAEAPLLLLVIRDGHAVFIVVAKE